MGYREIVLGYERDNPPDYGLGPYFSDRCKQCFQSNRDRWESCQNPDKAIAQAIEEAEGE